MLGLLVISGNWIYSMVKHLEWLCPSLHLEWKYFPNHPMDVYWEASPKGLLLSKRLTHPTPVSGQLRMALKPVSLIGYRPKNILKGSFQVFYVFIISRRYQ